jgi:hypothetical protein
MPRFHLHADVSSDEPDRVRPVVTRVFPAGVTETAKGFHVEADVEGESARDLNRELLSALRQAERRTRLRAEWTSGGTTERFFDYVPKATRPAR